MGIQIPSDMTLSKHTNSALHAKQLKPLHPNTRLATHTHTKIPGYNPKLRLTSALTLFTNSSLRSRHILAASTFAGLSSFGSAIILMTEMRIFSTL